ncbi:hypothetical protein EYF80_050726 [Liparis tanakae]|uniref:Secreted protein n=1 Tax=Liparis tanakae TaxID=230148 RepID=A0A4Z2FDN3_9TELE|nr:hypothetical protein EYF80_050726 [Liparis tanakae]
MAPHVVSSLFILVITGSSDGIKATQHQPWIHYDQLLSELLETDVHTAGPDHTERRGAAVTGEQRHLRGRRGRLFNPALAACGGLAL